MSGRFICIASVTLAALVAGQVRAEVFKLLVGVDAGRYPGGNRSATPVPGPGFDGVFNDGQRLAGTPSVGPTVTWQGSGTPLYTPNHVGVTSFYFKRGSVPTFGANRVPFMGIDFLGGPLLDLDGNPAPPRSLVPVNGQTPVAIPGSESYIDLNANVAGGTISLVAFDATGTNEGGPLVNPGAAVTVNLLADGALNGGPAGPINPSFDTRTGTLAAFTGSGSLTSVYRISALNAEFFYDSIDPFSSSLIELGTFQHLQRLSGWLVRRDAGTGQFPTLAAQGLGGTRWPSINTVDLGGVFNRAFDAGFGLTVTIADGNASDRYTLGTSLGLALADFGGDLGAYFDNVVVPHLPAQATAFVYLESSGFGINNTGDPVFGNSIGYDMVIVAYSTTSSGLLGDVNGDGFVNAADAPALAQTLVAPASVSAAQRQRADVNLDSQLDARDVQAWLNIFLAP